MGVAAEISARWRVKLGWAVALLLYGACWVLPIIGDGSHGRYEAGFPCSALPISTVTHGPHIGYDGACLAHELFWGLITEGRDPIGSVTDVLYVLFVSIGWLANELFVLGLVAALLKWPRAAVLAFAGSLGIMISWQLAFLEDFPLLVGYWSWVGAGALALWLAAARLAQETRRGTGAVLAEPATLAVFLVPVLNAAAAAAMDAFS